jgi:hypothetical protein
MAQKSGKPLKFCACSKNAFRALEQQPPSDDLVE